MDPPCEQTDRHEWKHYLPATLVVGGKNYAKQRQVKFLRTRMHSSRMCTTCLLPVSPSMHCSWWGVYLVPWGCTWSQGGVPGPGGTWSWGMYLVLGGCLPVGGACLGVYLVRRAGTPPRQATPQAGNPPREQNDRQVQKILPSPKLRLRAVKIKS